jgi:hypothetical protein
MLPVVEKLEAHTIPSRFQSPNLLTLAIEEHGINNHFGLPYHNKGIV